MEKFTPRAKAPSQRPCSAAKTKRYVEHNENIFIKLYVVSDWNILRLLLSCNTAGQGAKSKSRSVQLQCFCGELG